MEKLIKKILIENAIKKNNYEYYTISKDNEKYLVAGTRIIKL